MLNKEFAEQYKKDIERMSFKDLCELRNVLEERWQVIISFCAPDDGTSEKLSIVEKAIERASINRRVSRMIRRA